MSHTGAIKSFGLPHDKDRQLDVTQKASRSGPLHYATQSI